MAGKKDESEDTDQIVQGLVCHTPEIGLYPIDDEKLSQDLK